MTINATRLFLPGLASILFALFAGAGVLLPTDRGLIDRAEAAPADSKSAGLVQGIHVRRTGDAPETRERAKMVINAQQAQCGSALMRQTCQTMLSVPTTTLEARSRCAEMMSPPRIIGNLHDIGQTVVDEYFAPTLGRSVRIVKTTVPKQAGMCETRIEQEEKREIAHYRADGFTRHERKTDKSGQPYWLTHEHRYLPGLADMFRTSFDAARLSGTATVSAPLGRKTLVPGRMCETRRVNAGAVEFVSCIHATGLAFPSHVTFEGEVVANGKTELVQEFVSYTHNVALSRDLFFPTPGEKATAKKPGEKATAEKNTRSAPNNSMNRWCAAEKSRTGVDPCEDDDE